MSHSDLGFVPDSHEDLGFVADAAPKRGGMFKALTTRDLSGASPYDPLAQVARLGQFANEGNQQLAGVIAEGSGNIGAGLKSRGFEQAGQNVEGAGLATAGALGTASEFLLPQNRLGVAAYLASPLMKAYQALKGPEQAYTKPSILAQLGQARTKVPAGDIQQALRDPSVFEAPSVADANAAYGEAVGPVQGVTKSLGQKLDKTILGEADYTDAINRAGRIINGTEMTTDAAGNQVKVPMDPQTALEGVQSINRFLKNKAYTAKLDPAQLSEIYDLKSGLMGWMEGNGSPDIRNAASMVRKAHVNENLSRIMPQNKFGGTDALRTMGAGGELAGATSLALAGHPFAAIPLAVDAVTASPAFLGGAIRNYQSLSSPAVMGAAGAAANAAQNVQPMYVVRPSALADAYARQRSNP